MLDYGPDYKYYEVMSECPGDSNERNCALKSAQWLTDNREVVVDNIGMRQPGRAELIIGSRGAFALETFTVNRLYAKGLGWDVAELGCISCGRLVEIEDDGGDLSVKFAEIQPE